MRANLSLLLNYLKKIVRSPSRLALTLSGLTLSVIILIVGLVSSETYLASKLSEIEPYNQYNATVIQGKPNYELYNTICQMDVERVTIELVGNHMYKVGEIKSYSENIPIFIKDIRVSNFSEEFLEKAHSSTLRYSGKLKYGRLISGDDIENAEKVAVIDEYVSQLLFGTDNSVGQTITFPVYRINEAEAILELDYYEKVEIIGIITGSTELKKIIESDNIEECEEIQTVMYTPLSLKLAGNDAKEYSMRITAFSNESNYLDNIDSIESAITSLPDEEAYLSYNYHTLRYGINAELESIQRVIMFVVLFMFVISGVCIINTMFFSIKERINEIGVRKSIGAFGEDIVIQFVFEGLVYGVISFALGSIISLFGAGCVYLLINGYEAFGTNLIISWESMALAFVIAIFIGMISSILPALYASKIKITDAIRYD